MELLARLEEIILDLLEKKGYELVELKLSGAGRNQCLRVFIWKEGGVTIDDCQKISESLSDILDSEDIFEDRYFLEVSSPGLDRPLRTLKDFKRAIGEKIAIQTVEGKEEVGIISDVNLDGVELKQDEQKRLFPWSLISVGKIIVEFK